MDREAWRAMIHGAARVRHDLATKPPPPTTKCFKKINSFVHQTTFSGDTTVHLHFIDKETKAKDS